MRNILSYFSLFTLCLLCTCLKTSLRHHRPLFGIVSTPSDFPDTYDPAQYSYVKETYPDYVDQSGGESIYIPYDLPDQQLYSLLDQVNAVILVGGNATYWIEDPITGIRQLSPFVKQIQKVINHVQAKNQQGIYLPLIGICQGMEVLLMALTDDPYLLDTFVDANIRGPLEVTQDGLKGRMFEGVSVTEAQFMSRNGTLFFNHMFGYNLSSLDKYEDIKESLVLTAIAEDKNNKTFMAAMEAKDWPMYMVMFHPERVLWEREVGNYSHPDQVMNFIMTLGRFWVVEAQKNRIEVASPRGEWGKMFFNLYEPMIILDGEAGMYIANGSKIINKRRGKESKLKQKINQ